MDVAPLAFSVHRSSRRRQSRPALNTNDIGGVAFRRLGQESLEVSRGRCRAGEPDYPTILILCFRYFGLVLVFIHRRLVWLCKWFYQHASGFNRGGSEAHSWWFQ